jgi:AcrR family transcriptional regulator
MPARCRRSLDAPADQITTKLGRPRSTTLDAKIRHAAMAIIRESGVSAMSLDHVAERAGVSKPTIYRRFAGKTELVVAAMVEACAPQGPALVGDELVDLIGFLEFFRSHFEANIQLPTLGSLLQESRTQPDLIAAFRKGTIQIFRHHLLSLVEAAGHAGIVRREADPRTVAQMLVGAFYARAIAGDAFSDNWARETLLGSGLLTEAGRKRLAPRTRTTRHPPPTHGRS